MSEVFVDTLQQGDIIVTPDRDMFNHLNMSGRKKYYEQGYYGQGIVVAVIDSGCSPHREFGDRLLEGVNMCSLGLTSNDSLDTLGHGTHVAGIIAGETCGIAPKAKILPVKVINAMGEGSVYDVVNAINWCRNWVGSNGEKVSIINMSLSSKAEVFQNNQTLFNAYHKAVKDAVDSGIAVIVAAGNTGTEEVLYPAYFDEVIAVGAVDVEKKVAYFTTKSKQVDVCQVGVDVLSTYYIGDKYKVDTGTSMAAPHVAGIAALLACKYREMFKAPIPEPVLYEMLKMNTIDLDIKGTDINTGAGFCTLNPSMERIKFKMKENDPNILVNGKVVVSDVAPFIVPPGRFVVPARFFVEQLGGQASYDNTTRVATFEIPV